MPTPVSDTTIFTCCVQVIDTSIIPYSVNFKEFDKRFRRTYFILFGSECI